MKRYYQKLVLAAFLFAPYAGFNLQPRRQFDSIVIQLAEALAVKITRLNNFIGQIFPDGVVEQSSPAGYFSNRHLIT